MALKVLVVGLLAAGDVAALKAVIAASNADDVAADILFLFNEKGAAETKLVEAQGSINEVIKKIADEHQIKVEELQQDLADVTALNQLHEKTIAELSKGNGMKPTIVVNKEVEGASFELNGKTYGFILPRLNHKGELITPLDVCADTALQAELVKIGSGMIYLKG